jgi:hypothetical protein
VNDYTGALRTGFPTTTVLPEMCLEKASFGCRYVEGPYTGDLDLCSFSETHGKHHSHGAFDFETGAFEFASDDILEFPPGDYVFELGI